MTRHGQTKTCQAKNLYGRGRDSQRPACQNGQEQVESHGKGAIAGENGELKHCAALMHPALGKPMRANAGGGKALIPSPENFGFPGSSIDVALGHRDAVFVRSHFDAMEVRVPDAPRADELMLIVAVTDSGRPALESAGSQKKKLEKRMACIERPSYASQFYFRGARNNESQDSTGTIHAQR
jgi:hypothetical protein